MSNRPPGVKIGDPVLVMSDRGELVRATYQGTDGLMFQVELNQAGAIAMGYRKAGTYSVSSRRLREIDAKA